MHTVLTIAIFLVLSFIIGAIFCYWLFVSRLSLPMQIRAWMKRHEYVAPWLIVFHLTVTGIVFGLLLMAFLPLK